jgi:hypothetical protein
VGGRRKADSRIQIVPEAGNPTAAVIDRRGLHQHRHLYRKTRLEPDGHSDAFLADTALEEVLKFYEDNRNCAPSSKRTMALLIRRHLMKWPHQPIFTIDALMLQTRYKEVIAQVKADGVARSKRYAKLPEKERLLRAPDGYYTGIKTANDVIEGFGRIYRYWTTKHMTRLQRAGILVPVCPTVALLDDLEPEPKRVKGVPIPQLRILFLSFSTYEDNQPHPLLVRFLLASGIRVGVAMGCRKEYIKADRIVIPADADREQSALEETSP